jgi:hypothetical protein
MKFIANDSFSIGRFPGCENTLTAAQHTRPVRDISGPVTRQKAAIYFRTRARRPVA